MRKFLIIFILIGSCKRKSLEERVEELIEANELRKAEWILLKKDTSEIKVKILLGEVYRIQGREEEALKVYLSCGIPGSEEEKNKLVEGLFKLGYQSERKGKKHLARASYERILLIQPEYDLGEGFRLLAELYFSRHDYEKASDYYRRYLESGGESTRVLLNYSRTLYEIDSFFNVTEMEEELKKLESAEAYWILGNSLLKVAEKLKEKEEEDSSLLFLSRLIALGRPEVLMDDAFYLKGTILERKGDTLSAIRCYRKVLHLLKGKSPLRKSARRRLRELTGR